MLEDREIIRRCQAGQLSLMSLLIDRYQVALYSLCRKLTRRMADADDLFQDTWVAVMKNIATFAPERRFSPWLFAICVNRYRDLFRRRRRWLRRIREFASGDAQDRHLREARSNSRGPDEEYFRDQQHEFVRQAIDELDDALRLPILLHYQEGFSMEEIGDILGIPPGTAKSRLSNARRKLKTRLEERGYGNLD